MSSEMREWFFGEIPTLAEINAAIVAVEVAQLLPKLAVAPLESDPGDEQPEDTP